MGLQDTMHIIFRGKRRQKECYIMHSTVYMYQTRIRYNFNNLNIQCSCTVFYIHLSYQTDWDVRETFSGKAYCEDHDKKDDGMMAIK